MKNFQQAFAVAILTLVLAVSASANSGIIHSPGATLAAPGGTIDSPTAPGETSTPPSIMTTVILTIISLIS